MSNPITSYELENNSSSVEMDGAARINAVSSEYNKMMERFSESGFDIYRQFSNNDELANKLFKSSELKKAFESLTIQQQWDVYLKTSAFSAQNLLAYLTLFNHARMSEVIVLETRPVNYVEFHQAIADHAESHFCDQPVELGFIEDFIKLLKVESSHKKRVDILTIMCFVRALFGKTLVIETAHLFNDEQSSMGLDEMVKILIQAEKNPDFPVSWTFNLIDREDTSS